MKKWVFFSDLIFTFFAVFLPILCLLRHYRLPLFSATLVAGLTGLGVALLVGASKKKKDARLSLRRSEEREKSLLLYHLALLSPSKSLSLLYPNETPTLTDGVWMIEKEELLFPLFSWKPLEKHEVLPMIRLCLEKQKSGTILCDDITEDTAAFLTQFSVQVKRGEEIYATLKEENRLPSEYLSEPYFTKKKKRLSRVWFAKSNSRRFLTCGALLLLSSLIVPFSYYYLLFGCLLVVAAVLIRTFGYR